MGELYLSNSKQDNHVMQMAGEKRQLNQGALTGWLRFVLLILLAIEVNPDWRGNQIIWWGIVAFSSFCTLLKVSMLKSIRVNRYIVWIIVFNLWVASSILWSSRSDYAIDTFKILLVESFIVCMISLVIKSKEDLFCLLTIIMYSTAILSFYVLLNFDISQLGKERLGVDILGSSWNANHLAIKMAVGILSATVLIKHEAVKRYKIMYIFLTVAMTSVALLSGSRTGLCIVAFSCSLYFVLSTKHHKIKSLIAASICIYILYYAIISIPTLYNILGSRVQELIFGITGKGHIDGSSLLRFDMMKYGLKLFTKRPIIGYGIDNFREVFGSLTGIYMYSHNNIIEILVGTGIIGTIIYFYSYGFILKNSITNFSKDNGSLDIFGIVVVLTFILSAFGSVTYNDFGEQVFLCICFIANKMKSEQAGVKHE